MVKFPQLVNRRTEFLNRSLKAVSLLLVIAMNFIVFLSYLGWKGSLVWPLPSCSFYRKDNSESETQNNLPKEIESANGLD